MAVKGETSSSTVRNREFLLEIEAKVQKWWEDEKVFSAGCKKPGDKFFGKFPFDSFMGNPFSLSKLKWLPDIPIDIMRFALVYVCDGAVDEARINFLQSNADSVYNAANTAILKFNEEISWHEEFLTADFDSSLRCGPPSTFADRVLANEINVALNRTKEQYEDGLFRGALDSIFELQDARDWYKISCGGTNAMNRDLVWRFMDVQTCLITPICPHYAEYVWRDLLYKTDFVVNADWPVADASDESILRSANKYLKDLIDSMKRQVKSEINKKGTAPATTSLTEESQNSEALIYVDEAGDTLTIATEVLRTDYKQNGNEFKQNAKVKFGDQYLDLKLPFREEVLLQNLDFIKREIGLDKVRVLSANNPRDLAKAGPPVKSSHAESSSPGNPAILSLTCPKKEFRSFGTSETPPLMADLSSSGSAPKHTNSLTEISLRPQYKLPQKLSQREAYYPEKSHSNPASLYDPPSKLLFQGSFDKDRVPFLDSTLQEKQVAKEEEEGLLHAMEASMESLRSETWSGSTFKEDLVLPSNTSPLNTKATEEDEDEEMLSAIAASMECIKVETSSTASSSKQDLVPFFSRSTTLTEEEKEQEERLFALEAFVERMKLETSNASTSKGDAREKEDPLEMLNIKPIVSYVTEVDEEEPLWSMADVFEERSAGSSKVHDIVTREEEDEELRGALVASLGSWGTSTTDDEELQRALMASLGSWRASISDDEELRRALAASMESVGDKD